MEIKDRNPSVNLAQIEPLGEENKPGNLEIKDRNPSVNLAQIEPLGEENKPGNLEIKDRNPQVNLAQVNSPPIDSSVVQQTVPGDFHIIDQEAVDSTIVQLSEEKTK